MSSRSFARKRPVVLSKHLRAIYTALEQEPVDVEALRSVAHQGFVNNALRRKVWPHLLGVGQEADEDKTFTAHIVHHKYYDQVGKDIDRSMFHFDVTKQLRKHQRQSSRESLARIINTIFSIHTDLHYIQGYHDIVSVFLLVCGEHQAYYLVERLSLLHIRDSLRPSLETVVQVINLVFPLIQRVDPEVHAFLLETQVQSFFTLSWVLTWFAHNLERLEEVARIFDFMLASHPLMVMYFAVAMILNMRKQLLALPPQHELVHQLFQEMPTSVDVDPLIATAKAMFEQHPPKKLYAECEVKLPDDSPLFVGHVDELPSRLTHILAISRRRYREAMRAEGTASGHSATQSLLYTGPRHPEDDDEDDAGSAGGRGGKQRRGLLCGKRRRFSGRRANLYALLGIPVVSFVLYFLSHRLVA